MSFDWNNAQQVAQREAKNHEDLKTKIVVNVGNAIARRFDNNPDDAIVNAIQVMLGLRRDADVTEALAKAGFAVTKPEEQEEPQGPAALPAAKERPLPVYNPDGSSAGVALYEEEAHQYGLVRKTDAAGEVIGWVKPPNFAAGPGTPMGPAAPAPTGALDLDKEVPVKDAHGLTIGRIKIGDGMGRPNLEFKLDASGQHFFLRKEEQKKGRLIRRS